MRGGGHTGAGRARYLERPCRSRRGGYSGHRPGHSAVIHRPDRTHSGRRREPSRPLASCLGAGYSRHSRTHHCHSDGTLESWRPCGTAHRRRTGSLDPGCLHPVGDNCGAASNPGNARDHRRGSGSRRIGITGCYRDWCSGRHGRGSNCCHPEGRRPEGAEARLSSDLLTSSRWFLWLISGNSRLPKHEQTASRSSFGPLASLCYGSG